MMGIKQEAFATELGDDWNQKKVSLLEQKETIANLRDGCWDPDKAKQKTELNSRQTITMNHTHPTLYGRCNTINKKSPLSWAL
jgi:hypothetical protein